MEEKRRSWASRRVKTWISQTDSKPNHWFCFVANTALISPLNPEFFGRMEGDCDHEEAEGAEIRVQQISIKLFLPLDILSI
jgi:hypothetical protein